MLEAESIHILREVVAEFQRPVMLYSIGKDSSVMVRLAQKAFYPGKIPFPLLHIDTTYKFREMIEFRDRFTAAIGARLIVHTNWKAIQDGANPFRLGTQKCCGLLKTRALLDALAAGGYDAAFGAHGAMKRNRAPRSEFIRSAIRLASGIPRTSGPSFGIYTTAGWTRERASVFSRFPTGPNSTSGSTSTWRTSRSYPCTSRRSARCWCAATA